MRDDLFEISPSATADIPIRDRSDESPRAMILIVEDDVSLGKFLSRALKLKLFAVEVTLDGEAAWEALQKSHYDLVILDLNLPGMDGMALLARVRQIRPGLRMLVLTARSRTEDRVLALERSNRFRSLNCWLVSGACCGGKPLFL
jgi:CheY-like chemotaxis protein